MNTNQRITLMLDSTLVIEGMVLKRLETLERSRRQAWLRSLLGHGYLLERRWVQAERLGSCADASRPSSRAHSISPFSQWLSGSGSSPRRLTKPDLPPGERELESHVKCDVVKPFSHLRRVVG